MIRRNVIGTASAVLLLAVTACDSGSNGPDDDDVVLDDSGRADAGNDAEAGSGPVNDGGMEAGAKSDSGMDSGKPDAEMDAAPLDASVVNDAQVADATADAANVVIDAATDAAADDAAAIDAAIVDAQATADGAAGDGAQGDAAAIADAALPSLTARYTFDENSGTAAADSTNSFAAASLVNGASWTTGKLGGAVDLAGGATNQHVALPVKLLEGCDEVTVAMWMKLGSTPFWARLLDIDGLANGFLYFTPTQEIGGDPHLLFNIFHPDGNNDTVDDQRVSAAYPEGTELVDVWHHVAFTQSGGIGRLYFDGVEIGSNAMLWSPATLTYNPAGHAWLGRSLFGSDAYLDASLDDLRIACTAYSAAEIAALAE
jgi:hypothetical protein